MRTGTQTCNASRPFYPDSGADALHFCYATTDTEVAIGLTLAAVGLLTYIPQWHKIAASGHNVGLSWPTMFCGTLNSILCTMNVLLTKWPNLLAALSASPGQTLPTTASGSSSTVSEACLSNVLSLYQDGGIAVGNTIAFVLYLVYNNAKH